MKYAKHEKAGDFCQGCKDRLTEGDPLLDEWFWHMKRFYPDMHTSWVWRSKSDQDNFFAAGNSLQRWPDSPHNAMKQGAPCARAIDVFQQDSKGRAIFSSQFCFMLNEASKREGFQFFWGGSWRSIHDYNHWQIDSLKSK